MFERNELGKAFSLVRNPQWDPATDPNRKALPDRIEVSLNVEANDIDNRLQAGDLDVDVAGAGVQAAAQGKILADPRLKANTDSALSARLWFTALNSDVPPLGNIYCRRAVLYAADRTGYQRAYGGETGGEIATNLLPPVIPGAEKFDLYESSHSGGDLSKAREELVLCGQPSGFRTNISYRAELPREKAAAEALQQSLGRAGIQLDLRPYPLADYITLYAGKPDYAKANNLGLMNSGWAADWPDGYGFLAQIVDSRIIRSTGGNTNFGVKNPRVDELLDEAVQASDTATREKIWVAIDRQVMKDAYILPGVWAKGLFYHPPNLTNVFITDGFQMYDYLALGTTRK
jgi:peptide/nickel transport system substrate-binding protein